jgi:hypothetical protein
VDKNTSDSGSLQAALAYAASDIRVFPVRADKTPLVKWKEAASTDPAAIAKAWRPHPHADPAVALDADTAVIDIDRKPGRNGFAEFERLTGVSVDDILTPQATTPSGGRHLYFATQGRRYNNNRVPGTTAIDLKTIGGYVVLPAPGNGRRWLRRLWETPLLPAPAWLDVALKREPLVLAPRAALLPTSADDPWVRKHALAALNYACARIAAALPGSRNDTRCKQCFLIGGYVGRGDISYAEAFDALFAAARAVPHDPPWHGLEKWVAQSIAAGMGQPLPISDTELFLRNLRARLAQRRRA